jgi:predicted HAD superfamily hydrolase
MKKVNSYDIFDTILARKCIYPDNIFDIIGDKYNIPLFRYYRQKAEKISNPKNYENIYNNLKNLLKWSETKKSEMQQIEIDTEKENLFLIQSNYNKINNGDILISDMYHSESIIRDFLQNAGFKKNVDIYVSYDGKYHGYMYKKLLESYNILSHTGDNKYSDIKKANEYNINTVYYGESINIKEEENILNYIFGNNFSEYIRKIRLMNPYNTESQEYKWYEENVLYNIPYIFVFCHYINDVYKKYNIDKILLSTRDCCNIEIFIKKLFPNLNIITFHSSRKLLRNPTEDYIDYYNDITKDNKFMIIDINSSCTSIYEFIKNNMTGIKNKMLPHICLMTLDLSNLEAVALFQKKKKLNIFMKLQTDLWERFNVDYIGTLTDYKYNDPIRKECEYNENFVTSTKNAINNFINNYNINMYNYNDEILHKMENYYDLFNLKKYRNKYTQFEIYHHTKQY